MTVYTQTLDHGLVEYSGSVTFKLTWAENRHGKSAGEDANARCPCGYAEVEESKSPFFALQSRHQMCPCFPYRFLMELP
jgi:hypothetical protein